MKLFGMLGGLAILASSGPAAAQTPAGGIVTLTPDQVVSIHIGIDGAVMLDSREAATLSELDMALVRRLGDPSQNAAASGASGIAVGADTPGLPKSPPIAPGAIRIAFARIGAQSVLVLENGYDQGLVYHARIERGAGLRPTDVCLVMSMRRGYENWPYAIDRVEISDIHLVPWRPGDPVSCA